MIPNPNLFTGSSPSSAWSDLYAIINTHFPGLWPAVDAAISQWATLLIEDATIPIALYLVGPPSSDKTTVVSMMKIESETFYVDDFTPASMVSHKAGLSPSQLSQVDLLPKLRGKVLLTPELNVLWAQPKEKLKSTISLLTRILDGSGFTSYSGNYGKRGYDEAIQFCWLGATTPISKRVWLELGKMGSRLYFFIMPVQEISWNQIGENLTRDISYWERLRICRKAIENFMKQTRARYPDKVKWDKKADQACSSVIGRYADLLARLRCGIEREYDYYDNSEVTSVLVERPDRAAQILYDLARGHALSTGYTQIDAEEIALIARVVLSSAPPERAKAFKLLHEKLMMPSDTFQEELNLSNRGAREIIRIFELAKLIDIKPNPQGARGRPFNELILKQEFQNLPLFPKIP